MEKERKYEIAIALIKYQLRQICLKDIKRELSNIARETGIDPYELREFIKLVLEEVVEEF